MGFQMVVYIWLWILFFRAFHGHVWFCVTPPIIENVDTRSRSHITALDSSSTERMWLQADESSKSTLSVRRAFYLSTCIMEHNIMRAFTDDIQWGNAQYQQAMHHHFVATGRRVAWDSLYRTAAWRLKQQRALGIMVGCSLLLAALALVALSVAALPTVRLDTVLAKRVVSRAPVFACSVILLTSIRPKGAGQGGYNGMRDGEASHPERNYSPPPANSSCQ